MKIQHDKQIVSFAFIDKEANLFTYYFELENGKINLHSIDKYQKNGKNSKTYKHVEIYHNEYKPTVYNYDTNEFEQPTIPEIVQKNANNYCKGYLVNCL